jgi:hypothetical protein
MSSELKQLNLPPLMVERLPLGFRGILVSESILDEDATRKLTFMHSKYRHVSTFVARPKKPISKVEL